MRNIALLGSTGSIGVNALRVIGGNREKYRLLTLSAGENIDLLARQVSEFSPQVVSVKDKKSAAKLKEIFPGQKIYYGAEGLLEAVSHPQVDTMISAITGTTALPATLQSIKNNQRICLANKETLVAAGDLINEKLARSSAELIPIDSEQSAIFQSIGLNHKDAIRKIILTASGGPFFKKSKADFSKITTAEALAHPTWSMGAKITIDSATLMNKALEIIEAFFLFKLKPEQIDVIIHPQSIIHSMVEFIDSSVIAQLSLPDMKIPILYSLSYPDRVDFNGAEKLDFSKLGKLEFHRVDTEKFSSIGMARYVLDQGGNSGAVFNAANEVAVDYFLQGKITFRQIFSVVEEVLYKEKFYPAASVPDIEETIKNTKIKTGNYIKENWSR
ncbi:MAG: 1-deoxy-D-xylulose-5-phosphate reductoisomerase [Candidatus Aminicenantes bacterium]|nr:1-deoxy-D-xylulose-5-phosphate reductoisomerase [Candidatus Aminicenantes bacterium]